MLWCYRKEFDSGGFVVTTKLLAAQADVPRASKVGPRRNPGPFFLISVTIIE
jgi:hypothetical protein